MFGSVANAQVIDTPGKAAPGITDAGVAAGICARTSQVRDAILARIDDVTDCADVTNTHLRGITGTLNLRSKSITALRAGDFAGLSSVKLLDLYDNALTTLPSGLLTGLSKLTVLYLDDNALTALPADLMDPVPSLTELWARRNDLTEFPPGFFAGKRELDHVQIYHNPGDPDLKALDPIHYHRGNPLGVYVHLQALGDGRFKILVPVGTSFETVVSLEATNGILAEGTVTLAAGRTESDVLTVARTAGTSSSVTVDIVDVRSRDRDRRYPGKVTPMFQNGIVITRAGDLPVTVHPARKPEVHIAPRDGAGSVTEGTAAEFTLTRDLPHDGALTVTVGVSQTGEVIKSAGAYRAPGSVEFPAGEGTATLTVETQADTVDEPRGTITATVTAAASDPYTVGDPAAADVAVDDDDETTATVAAVSLSSDPPAAGVYAIGDTVRATVSFSVGHSGPVTVSGRPQLALTLGAAQRRATYESGSGSTTLVFAYTVTDGDAAAGGVALAADSLSPNGGSIANAGGDADLAHAALAADPAHVVDGVRPALRGAATSEDGTSVVLTYGEALDPANPPAKSAFGVTMNGADVALSGAPSVSGTEVALPLTVALRHGAPVTVSYTDPSTADDAEAVQDRYGNDAASEAVAVTNNVPETAGPYMDLVLDPASVTEDGGVSTVTATLTGPAPAAFTVAVTAIAVSPALASDFSLSGNATLSFAAGATASTGTVLITAVDNDARTDDKTVTVSGRISDGSGLEPPPDRTLTIRDDEPSFVAVCDRTPKVRDALVGEAGAGTCGQVIQADLDRITYLDLAGAGITSLSEGDFSGLTHVRTITVVGNQLRTLPAGIFHGLAHLRTILLYRNPSLALPPGIFLGLTGLGGLRLHRHQLPVGLKRVAPGRFTATIATGAPFELAVRVSVTNGALLGGTSSLTIPAGSIESGAVAVTRTGPGAVEVDIAGFPALPRGHYWYSLVKADGLPLEVIEAAPPNTAPTITTSSPIVVAENNTAVATLEARDPDAGHAFTWTKVGGADADRFELSPGGALSFVAAPDYEMPADLAGTDPPSPAGDNEYVVTVEVADGQGGRASKTLDVWVTDLDEEAPELLAGAEGAAVDWDELTLSWNEALDEASVPDVGAFAVDVAGRSRGVTGVSVHGSEISLTLATAVAAGDAVRVSYTAPSGGDAQPIQDEAHNDAATFANRVTGNETPRVALVLSPMTIAESGASNRSTVAATLSSAAPAAFTVTVEASAVAPAAVADFVLGAGRELRFAEGATASTGTVTITAVDNAVDAADKSVTVSGVLSEGARVTGPDSLTLTVADDDEKPGAPAGLNAAAGDRSVTLSWTAPVDAGTQPITGYQYRQKQGSGGYGPWEDITGSAPGEADAASHTVIGLANGTAYAFELRAVSAAGDGAASQEATATPERAGLGAPTDFRAVGGDELVTLTWRAPEYGDPITGYQFRFCRVVTPTDCSYEQAAPTGMADWYPTESATSQSVRYWYVEAGGHTYRFRMVNGTTYRFQVRALAGEVVGAPTAKVAARPVAP